MSRVNDAVDRYLNVMQPAEQLRQQRASKLIHDEAGNIFPGPLQPHLAPIPMRWGPGDTGDWPTLSSGTIVQLLATADTPPSGGPCVIEFTIKSDFAGTDTIGTLEIPAGQESASIAVVYEAPANAWVKATITDASGAGGVSRAIRMKAGDA